MKALCIGVVSGSQDFLDAEESLLELKELGRSAGFEVTGTLLLSCSKIFPATYISRPMAEEVIPELEEEEIKVVLFNEELSPSQLKNLETLWDRMIIDRTELILKIFQEHAKTQEARLQVEIAQLRYTLPRLKRMWTHLSRIEGGFGFTKGPGETQIEIDRRIIKDRISSLSKKLSQVSVRRETRRKKRMGSHLPLVSLAGYTNAGKTSILNLLAKEKLQAEDKLFATLSPVTRKVYLQEGKYALISDTVGFIKKLPTQLVASFHSTLQEIQYSDLILLVQDVSSAHFEKQKDAVISILGELDALNIPMVQIFSKTDLISENHLNQWKSSYPDAVFLSSKTGEGLSELKEKILNFMIRQELE